MQIGIVGLGRMGANIARRLIKNGHKVVAFDRTPKVVKALEGATGADSLKDLVDKPELADRFRGQVVFVGVTSISGSYDRVATPFGQGRIPGVEVHARLFETLERG